MATNTPSSTSSFGCRYSSSSWVWCSHVILTQSAVERAVSVLGFPFDSGAVFRLRPVALAVASAGLQLCGCPVMCLAGLHPGVLTSQVGVPLH